MYVLISIHRKVADTFRISGNSNTFNIIKIFYYNNNFIIVVNSKMFDEFYG